MCEVRVSLIVGTSGHVCSQIKFVPRMIWWQTVSASGVETITPCYDVRYLNIAQVLTVPFTRPRQPAKQEEKYVRSSLPQIGSNKSVLQSQVIPQVWSSEVFVFESVGPTNSATKSLYHNTKYKSKLLFRMDYIDLYVFWEVGAVTRHRLVNRLPLS